MNKSCLEFTPLYKSHITGKDLLYPTAINIELTTYCNLRCIMCPKTSGIARTPPNATMDESILDRIIDEVVPHVFRIDLVGDGEILLVPHLVKKVLTAAQNAKILVNASTNGVLLNEHLANMLVTSGLHDLNISLDAADKQTYGEIRGADLDQVLSNINRLNEIKKQTNSVFPRLQFSMVGMKRNIDQLPDLVHLAARYGAQSVMVQAMGEFDPVRNESIMLWDRAHGRRCVDDAQAVSKELGIAVILWPHDQFDDLGAGDALRSETSSFSAGLQQENPLESCSKRRLPEAARTAAGSPELDRSFGERNPLHAIELKDCDFPWDVPYFATDGSVRPCCAMPPLGNLLESSFEEIWFGKNYAMLRAQMKSPEPPDECIRCPGRGWYRPIECKSQLIPGRDDRQFGTGWFETETYKNESYRWAREKAVFFVAGAGPGLLELDIHTVWDIGTTQDITIQVNGGKAHAVHFAYGERRIVHLPVNDSGPIHRVVITGQGWRPAMTVPGERDPRSLTVMFYGARFQSGIDPVSFGDVVTLRHFEIKMHGETGHHRMTFYWEILKESATGLRQFIHVMPAFNRFKHVRLLGFELNRKFDRSKRFQMDMPFPLTACREELLLQELELTSPETWPAGHYNVFLGLLDPQGKRVSPLVPAGNRYRSSLFIGDIVIG